jgi:hypothetical protein
MELSHRTALHRICISLGAVAALAACNVSATTAKLGDIKLGNDADISTPATTFSHDDTVYAKTAVQYNGGTVTVQWHLFAVDVPGTAPGELDNAKASADVEGNGAASYHIKPGSGWPPGSYKIEADMLYSGSQKDQKTVNFTVQ